MRTYDTNNLIISIACVKLVVDGAGKVAHPPLASEDGGPAL